MSTCSHNLLKTFNICSWFIGNICFPANQPLQSSSAMKEGEKASGAESRTFIGGSFPRSDRRAAEEQRRPPRSSTSLLQTSRSVVCGREVFKLWAKRLCDAQVPPCALLSPSIRNAVCLSVSVVLSPFTAEQIAKTQEIAFHNRRRNHEIFDRPPSLFRRFNVEHDLF